MFSSKLDIVWINQWRVDRKNPTTMTTPSRRNLSTYSPIIRPYSLMSSTFQASARFSPQSRAFPVNYLRANSERQRTSVLRYCGRETRKRRVAALLWGQEGRFCVQFLLEFIAKQREPILFGWWWWKMRLKSFTDYRLLRATAVNNESSSPSRGGINEFCFINKYSSAQLHPLVKWSKVKYSETSGGGFYEVSGVKLLNNFKYIIFCMEPRCGPAWSLGVRIATDCMN